MKQEKRYISHICDKCGTLKKWVLYNNGRVKCICGESYAIRKGSDDEYEVVNCKDVYRVEEKER